MFSVVPASRRPLLLLLLLLPALASVGCRIDVVRYRGGSPLDEEAYETLEVDRTTREEVVRELGAPEKLEWKSGNQEEYLWYLYADLVNVGLRFQFPPFRSFFGYQHTFFRLNENAEEVNAMQLVFDEEGVLRHKSLRLSETYAEDDEEDTSRKWLIRPTLFYDRSVMFLGDGGVRDYDEMFENGYRTGLDVAVQLFPIVSLLAGGNYQRYGGDSDQTGFGFVEWDDLELYQARAGVRLSIPLQVLFELSDFNRVKHILFEEDLWKGQGLVFYLQGTTGFSYNESVSVEIDGVDSGDFYDGGLVLSSGATTGLEYDWSWGSIFAGISYQSVGAFDEGDSPLDGDGGSFEAVHIGGGLSVKF